MTSKVTIEAGDTLEVCSSSDGSEDNDGDCNSKNHSDNKKDELDSRSEVRPPLLTS